MKKEQIKFTMPELYSNLQKLFVNENSVYLGAHYHSEIEIIYVKNGSILCWIEEEPIHISENHICIVGSNVIHHLTFDDAPAEIVYLQIDLAKIIRIIYPNYTDVPLLFDDRLKKHALFSEGTLIFSLWQTILYELEMKKPYFETATMGGFIQLTAHLQREMLVADYVGLFENPMFLKIYPIILYANEHYGEKVYLDAVCDLLHIDKYYLCKIFKKTTGLTFFQYLGRVRLQNAEKLLVTTDKSITQIALECGFSTVQYFHAAFVKARGSSPMLYRKAYHKHDMA